MCAPDKCSFGGKNLKSAHERATRDDPSYSFIIRRYVILLLKNTLFKGFITFKNILFKKYIISLLKIYYFYKTYYLYIIHDSGSTYEWYRKKVGL